MSHVSFVEKAGSPSLTVGREAVTGKRVFRCAWDDRMDLAAELVGGWQGGGTGGQRTFRWPMRFPGYRIVIVDTVDIEPDDPESPDGTATISSLERGTNHYTYAELTATYRMPPDDKRASGKPSDYPDPAEGTILEYEEDFGGEYLSIDGLTWVWSNGDPLATDVSPGIYIAKGQKVMNWQHVPEPPWTAIRQLRGKVNDAAFLGEPAGVLMFAGASVRKRFAFDRSDAGNYWDVRYTFMADSKRLVDGTTTVGWNYFYKKTATGGEHWATIKDADGNKPYGSGTMTDLFVLS